jgi:hypothetical protein
MVELLHLTAIDILEISRILSLIDQLPNLNGQINQILIEPISLDIGRLLDQLLQRRETTNNLTKYLLCMVLILIL